MKGSRTDSGIAFSIGLPRCLIFATAVAAILGVAMSPASGDETPQKRIPVIFDTDIGSDIDDTWALVLLLKSPEFDVRLVVSDQHAGDYRAKLLAKFLELAGRTDIPVGVGVGKRGGGGGQVDWVKDYDLASYPGTVHEDGVQAIIDTIMKSDEMITLIAVGPVPNLEEALRREPRIAEKARFVGMHGGVRKGYGGNEKVVPEYNVRANPKACQAVFTAPLGNDDHAPRHLRHRHTPRG